MADSTLLIQFAKSAVAGRVKTRLVPPLTTHQAANLHTCLVIHTCTVLCNSGLGKVQLWLTGEHQESLVEYCRAVGDFKLRQQSRGDLGERMAHALQRGLERHQRVILVGSDAPAIDEDYLRAAERELDNADVVLGPALDGGYVLIGLNRFSRHLFKGMEWGTDSVLEETLQRVDELGWRFALLPEIADIDRPEDLRFLPETLSMGSMGPGGPQAETLAS